METIFDYFQNFNSLESYPFLIVKDALTDENVLFFRIFIKKNEKYQYLGITFIPPEITATNANHFCHENILLPIFENSTLEPFIPFIKNILTIYLKKEVKNNLDTQLKK